MVAAQSQSQCLSHQKMLLLQFRSSLNFDSTTSTKLARWNHTTHHDCCVWPGVECDTSGRVISLILDNEGIDTEDGIHNSSALFSLQYLERLNLAYNDFHLTPIPVQIYNLTNLTYLNLSNAGFGGQIPNGISRLTRLVTLDLSIDWGFALEIPNLNQFFENSTQLRQIYLVGVDLSSTVVPKFLANFSNLKTLNLSRCMLQGEFPREIFLIHGLQELSLEYNNDLSGGFPSFPENGSLRMISVAATQFSGSLPASISNLSNLSRLVLYGCNFSGSIPSTMAQLTSLTHVDFSFNHFTGSIPHFLSSKNLTSIDFSLNGLTGPLSSKHFEGFSKIVYLNLESNFISGRIPPSLFSLPSLQTLDLSNNSFDGLGDEYVNVSTSQLDSLYLSSNRLNGSFPEYFFEFPMLSDLDLSSNSLGGKIQSSLFSLPSLKTLDLSNNSFDGLSDEYVNVSTSQLQTLHLSSNHLSGSFPKYFFEFPMLSSLVLSSNSLGGKIQASLFSLPSLWNLDLSNNSFDGLGDEYVNVSTSQLDSLYLSSNRLNGSFPEYFFEFPMLSGLDLSSNSLGGKIQSSLFSLPSLKTLDLSNNSFDGLSDEYVNVSTSQLQTLHLSSNRLSGSFPKYFFEFPKLSELHLSSNFLGGKIPSSLFSLPSLNMLDLPNNSFDGLGDEYVNVSTSQLDSLYLSSNRLNGSFPEYFFEFPMLSDLDLSSNSLGEMIEFESLQKLTNLRGLNLSNNEIRGEIPSWIWKLGNGSLYHLNLSCNFLESLEKPYTIPSSLTVLDLHSNQLQGPLPIPPACNDGDGPIHLDYSHNFFNGSIPFGLGSFARNAYFLSLANNSFTGTIPESICNASYHLKILDLSDNELGGTLPSCLFNSFNRLGVLILRKNEIHGSVPDSFTIYCSLQTLDLSRNLFEGKIPKSLINCSLLEVLNVGSNNIVDTFPCTLKNLSSLRVLVLRSNNFHGDLQCVHANHIWPNLQIIDIASNNFSGKLSWKFLNWKRMIIDEDTAESGQYIMFNHLSLIGNRIGVIGHEPKHDPYEYYKDILMVTWKGMEMEMVKILKVFTFVDFSCNNFYGVIPESIGALTSLYVLNLSHNGLTGNIPETIGNLKMIESLDFSANQLGGEIPTQLAKLTFLSVMNLSFNKLSGMIPTGNQLNTFGPDSYIGNQELCGFPLPKSCKSPKTSNGGRSEIEIDGGSTEIKWEYVSSALGFAVGLGAYLWMLLHNKRCREAYQQLDEVLIRLFGPRQRGRKSPGLGRRVRRN
ncbi:receptor-like protein 7 [Ipomoea triloba]|uniref:receptor-like protein 7 n=1 Tax=Ipomoea triloba TaxID=35885 RepID=UPI00125E60DE|nr:receptor-like protein 7 [Ipomoea triloba]